MKYILQRIFFLTVFLLYAKNPSMAQTKIVTYFKNSRGIDTIDINSGLSKLEKRLVGEVNPNSLPKNLFFEKDNILYYVRENRKDILDTLMNTGKGKHPLSCEKTQQNIDTVDPNTDKLRSLIATYKLKVGANTSKLYTNSTGAHWIASEGGGIYLIEGENVTRFKKCKGLPSNFVYDLIEDRNGNMWFATFNGISRYANEQFIYYKRTNKGEKVNRVTDFIDLGSGEIGFKSKYGRFGIISDEGIEYYEEMFGQQICKWAEDDLGNMWLFFNEYGDLISPTYSKTLCVDATGKKYCYEQHFNKNDVENLSNYTDSEGNQWIITYQYIGLIQESKKLFQYNGYKLCKIIEDEQYIWFISTYGSAYYNKNDRIFNSIIKKEDPNYKSLYSSGLYDGFYTIYFQYTDFIIGNDISLFVQYSVIDNANKLIYHIDRIENYDPTPSLSKQISHSAILIKFDEVIINLTENFTEKDNRFINTYIDSDGNFWFDTPTQIHKMILSN